MDDEPDLEPAIEPYMAAFRFLSRGRRLGFGAGGIPISDMIAYAQALGFLDLPRFIRLTAALDEEFLLIYAKKAASA